MKGKRFFSTIALNAIDNTRSPLSNHVAFNRLIELFPSLPKDKGRDIKSLCELKEKFKTDILPDLIKQADAYLNSHHITSCTEAIAAIMDFIHSNNIQDSADKGTLKNLAAAYYIQGMVKAAGSTEDRLEAEKFLVKAIVFAKKSGAPEIQKTADNQLRSLELHRFKLREGESIVFEEEPSTSNIARNHT
jgi:hypothetical protein